jgi:hypothetical protein
MACSEQPIHFANAALGTERHICAFFNSSDEETGYSSHLFGKDSNAGRRPFTS